MGEPFGPPQACGHRKRIVIGLGRLHRKVTQDCDACFMSVSSKMLRDEIRTGFHVVIKEQNYAPLRLSRSCVSRRRSSACRIPGNVMKQERNPELPDTGFRVVGTTV